MSMKEFDALMIKGALHPIPKELIEKMEIGAGRHIEMEEMSGMLEKITQEAPQSLMSVVEDIAKGNEKLPAAGLEKRIRALKKEMKNAKNLMERKRINKELSATYVEKKHQERSLYRRWPSESEVRR